jgi:hypothetical protein
MKDSASASKRKKMQKRKPIRSKAILNAARDEPCTICGIDDRTTVFCHLNESWAGKGMGQKADDIAGFFGCSKCHRQYDVDTWGLDRWEVMRGMYRTWRRLWEKGIIGELK